MKIRDERKKDHFVNFKDIPIGEMFEDSHGIRYLKIDDENSSINVFNFEGSFLDRACSNLRCKPIESEIILKRNL